jgi:hypothetical protein
MAKADDQNRSDDVDLTRLGLPPVGTTLTVIGDDATASVIVQRALDDRVVAAVAGDGIPVAGQATIRWFDSSRPSAEADALLATGDDPALVDVRICSPWRAADGRRSERHAVHRPMVAHVMQMVDNTLVPNLRLNLVCLDLSATGVRAAYNGRPPRVNELVEIELGATSVSSKRVLARVARVEKRPFHRWEIALLFVFDSAAERDHVLAVRNAIAAETSLSSGLRSH